MNYPNQTGYSNIPMAGNPRATEAWALTEAARRIADAQRADAPEGALLAAVRLNWRLWTIFQAEISSPECPLPVELRQNMLSLANFVDKTTVDLLVNLRPEATNILVTINRHIASGLFQVPGGDSAATEAGVAAPDLGGLSEIKA
ncbi:MAG TPA: flagellar biosynthesis regulator FlaF [Magnetospirillum sp.]|nr:flagellar biosynthesis regulator FlaF [Magnetospirillum sp.]